MSAGDTRKAPLRYRVIPAEDGQTLRVWVARRVPELDRRAASRLIKSGGVYVNKLRIRVPTVRVAAGERITIYPQAAEVEALDPAQLIFVYRDEHCVVLDKPAGVPVAQTRDSARGTLAEALRRQLAAEGLRRPYVGVVHRLDRGASGLVLFTIRDIANRSLHRQFVDHEIRREYRLLVHGLVEGSPRVAAPLRIRQSRVRVAEAGDPKAVSARTDFVALAAREHRGQRCTLLGASLHTGRTHQIRVHAAHLGHPLVGDLRYGPRGLEAEAGAEADASPAPRERLYLHALRLAFAHPISGAKIELQSSCPPWARTEADASRSEPEAEPEAEPES